MTRTLIMDNKVYLPIMCELVSQGHSVQLRARGTSMRPFIEPERDVLVLSPADSYDVGDIVLAEVEPLHYVVHRIIAINGARVTLQGDGNIKQQEHCTLSDLHARLTAIQHPRRTQHTDTRLFRLCSRLWVSLSPLRRPLLALYRLLRFGQLPQRLQNKLHVAPII